MSRSFITVIFFILTVAPVKVFSQTRGRLLTGWEFLKGDLGGIWEAVRPVGADNPESVPHWQATELPHCFNATDAVDPDVAYYQGPGWYRTQLAVKNPYVNGRTLLHFEGAGQKTEVYVYTTKVGAHTGGYDEWTVDITEAVEAFRRHEAYKQQFKGTIPVSIRCDNSRDVEMIPSDLSDFNLYGGLYRYVNLVYVPPVSVENIVVTPEVSARGDQATVRIKAELYDPQQVNEGQVKFRLLNAAGKAVSQSPVYTVANGQPLQWDTTVKKPALWSPDSPVLYTVEVSVTSAHGTQERREKFGFRSFEFRDHGPFFLNGKQLLLRGTHRHEDHAGVGSAMTEAMMREEVLMMKDMGVNFMRLGHYQQSRIILDLCDSLGILVWEEIPWCRGGLGNEVYKTQARQMLGNMIRQHYNHPSVIIWGLGNENDWPGDFPEFDKEKIRHFMKELNDLAYTLDPSRKTAIRRCSFCADIVDVYSPSIWAGWYRGRYTEYRDVSESEFRKVNHFLHVEWGGDSHARRHAEDPEKGITDVRTGYGADERAGDASLQGGSPRFSKDGDWSESYICNLIDWHLKEQETMPWLTGTAYWVFKDFSTPIRPDNPVPYVNQKGVVERDLTKKEAYYVFQSYWADRPMVRIYGHSWPVRWGGADERRLVKVYSNCDEAELFVNGKSYGKRKRDSQDFPAAGLRWMVPYKEGNNDLRVVATKGRVTVEDGIVQRYQTSKWDKPVKLVVEETDATDDTVTIEARLVDANNVLCLDAQNWIRFSLSGDGELIDHLGTSSGSNRVQAYNGRAVIRVSTRKGSNVLAVKSPGLATVIYNFDKKPGTP